MYTAYPKRAGKPAALAAIRNAIKQHGCDLILKATQQFAAATAGTDSQFIPYPAKWFSEERFLDDPATWKARRGPETSMRQNRFQNRIGKY